MKLELTETEIRFSPGFDASVENNFQQIVEQLLLDIKQTCDCMPRIVSDNSLSDDDDDDDDVEDDAESEGELMPHSLPCTSSRIAEGAAMPRHALAGRACGIPGVCL